MACAVWVALWMSDGHETRARVIVAAALVNQTKIPRTDGQLTFSFALKESDQLGDEIRENVAD